MTPLDAQLVDLAVDDVREGDLLFTARPGPLQSLVELAGDDWRHVGLAVVVDGHMSSCEVAGHRFQHRRLVDLVPRQRDVGVVRLADELSTCIAGAVRWTSSMLGRTNLYAWDDLILTGVLLAVRRRAPAALVNEVMSVISQAEALAAQHPREPGSMTFTCSSFVYQAFVEGGARCRLEVPVDLVRSRPGRFRAGGPEPLPLDDVLIAATGDDLPALQDLLDSFSLLELSGVLPGAERGRYRYSATSHANRHQLVAVVRNLVRLFTGSGPGELPERLVLDGRWISPGDLWRLENVSLRGRISTGQLL